MKTILLAALLVAAPVLAHGRGHAYGHDRDRDRDDEDDDDEGYPAWQAPPPDYAPPDQGPTFDDFRNDGELSWNGEWIDTPEYGVVWRPTRVDDDWQPYLYGRWAWTTAGWAWVSDEPFGWAVYHYGRWAATPMGWVWVPGRVWAPAWVAWRWNDGYAGWCPLGPRSQVYEQPTRWVYVPSRHFLEPISRHAVPRPERDGLPAPSWNGHGPYAGPPVPAVERATGHAVRPLAVTDVSGPHAAQAGSGSVGFYRPRTAPVAIPQPQMQSGPRGVQAAPGGGGEPRYGPRGVLQQQGQGSPHAGQGVPRAQQQGPASAPHPGERPGFFESAPAPRQGGATRPAPAARPHSSEPHEKEK